MSKPAEKEWICVGGCRFTNTPVVYGTSKQGIIYPELSLVDVSTGKLPARFVIRNKNAEVVCASAGDGDGLSIFRQTVRVERIGRRLTIWDEERLVFDFQPITHISGVVASISMISYTEDGQPIFFHPDLIRLGPDDNVVTMVRGNFVAQSEHLPANGAAIELRFGVDDSKSGLQYMMSVHSFCGKQLSFDSFGIAFLRVIGER
jgi:hypothetical protein